MTESLLEQSNLAHRRGDLRHALELSEKGLADPAANPSPGVRYELWLVKSHCLNGLGRWQEALGALESAAKAGDMNVERDATLAMHRGYIMGSLGRYADCWSLLAQSERRARQHNLRNLLAEVLWRRGVMSIFVGEYNSAEECLRSALELACADSNEHLQCRVVAGLAKNMMFRGEYADAITGFEEALASFERLEYPFYAAIMWCELANCYLHLEKLEKALELFQKAEPIFLEIGATPNYQVCLANIGNVYLYRREFLSAISYYQRALELARQLGDQLSVSKWLTNLGQAYAELGNLSLAKGFEDEAKSVNEHLAAERQRAAAVATSYR